MPEHKNQFEFHWKYKDYEIQTIQSFSTGLPYVELIKWDYFAKKPCCDTLAYYNWNSEGGELCFVRTRPFNSIAEIDIMPIWKQLWMACEMLIDWYEKEEHHES